MEQQNTNVAWHHATVTRSRREQLNQHKPVILRFTGFPGAGKSTLAHTVTSSLAGHWEPGNINYWAIQTASSSSGTAAT